MHIYRSSDAPRFVPDGHFGNLEVSNVAGAGEGAAFRAQLSFCPPGGGGDMHFHEDEDQLFIVVQGELSFKSGDEEFTLSCNEAVLFNAGEPHYTINKSEEPSVSVVITAAH